jgi:hypothetical protein
MKKFSVFPLIAALAFFVSCQKQQTEEERKAEVERQVQDRLAAERVETEKQRLAQDKAALEAREKAIADREAAATATITPAEEPAETAPPTVVTEQSEPRTEKRSTAAYGMFYQKLDQYGEWRETNDYGYVWQPREAEESRDWRPYTEGRWVYSDAGWTWVSEEPFGWATYHYGRWLRLRKVGWVWVPGDEWAPAWVSWRTNKDYVGWAPLPPEARFDRRSGIQNWADSYYDIGPDQYSFVPSNEFGAQKIRRAVVPAERNVSIVFETTNVTRITFANTTVRNEGPNYEELRSRSQRPIERYRLRRQNTETIATVRGDELEISAPVITEVRDMPRPRRIKERVIEINIDNGWTIADRSAAERARTKIRTESTPPTNAPPKVFVKPTESTAATASATPATTAAPASTASGANAATPTPTASANASPSPTPAKSAASPTPVTTAASPTATAAAAASATPAASPRIRPRPSPSATAATSAASPTPAAAATISATPATAVSPTPAASASVRVRPSPSIRPRPSPSIAASIAPETNTTPAASVSPAVRPRPSPPIQLRVSPTPAPKPELPPASPPVQRRTPPPVTNTPAPTGTPSSATETELKPSPTIPPVKRPIVPPRTLLPTPTVAPENSDTARPPVPPNGPKRIPPPRITPPPAVTTPAPDATPSVAPSAPAGPNDRAKNRRPKPPGPAETETGTPTPTPATPPN